MNRLTVFCLAILIEFVIVQERWQAAAQSCTILLQGINISAIQSETVSIALLEIFLQATLIERNAGTCRVFRLSNIIATLIYSHEILTVVESCRYISVLVV